MNNSRTMTRQYSEYSDLFSTQREREYERNADLPQRESTQVRWGGRDGRREPDSGLGCTQDHRTWWTGTLGSIQTHSLRRLNSRRVIDAEQEVG